MVSVVFAAFILPLIPGVWQGYLFRVVYSVIYISSVLALEKKSKPLLVLLFSTLFLEWFSVLFDIEAIFIISRSLNILFFLFTVTLLIRQIARSKEVTVSVISDSITGFLLLGLVYSILTMIIVNSDPASFSNLAADFESNGRINASVSLYYSFVTITSLGYGDIFPLTPLARSLATFMAVTGQFYIAIIVALLVGKFSSRHGKA
jgi:hypothetical protein